MNQNNQNDKDISFEGYNEQDYVLAHSIARKLIENINSDAFIRQPVLAGFNKLSIIGDEVASSPPYKFDKFKLLADLKIKPKRGNKRKTTQSRIHVYPKKVI